MSYGQMTTRRARRLLWGAALLLVPLPYFVMVHGHVPVVRMGLLGCITIAYAGAVDGSGVAWPMAALLWAHALTYGVLLWGAAALLARFVPARARSPFVWFAVGSGAFLALYFEIYHTPFAAESARSNWLGLFQ